MKNYIIQTDPFIVPTADGKLIEEHFGNASLKYEGCSVCRCEAHPGWKESYQSPEFDEIVLVSKGKLEVKIDKEKLIIRKGESILLKKGGRIRFRNSFDEPSEFYSICLPPFSLKTVHRE
ncbi:MAG: cupin domain-containing protein [Cyclobacteriaceae bacterium]|nr:cupin domain-containing protein [Cyclobacteriaceae bacterium]